MMLMFTLSSFQLKAAEIENKPFVSKKAKTEMMFKLSGNYAKTVREGQKITEVQTKHIFSNIKKCLIYLQNK